MLHPKPSPCGRFVVLDGLHLDRAVLDALAAWASKNGLRLQDAIQLAVCAFNAGADALRALPPEREDEGRVGLLRVP